jgi:hypothetical protein
MTSTDATFTHIDLNVEITLFFFGAIEITHLLNLNIDVETSLTNQSIVDLEESDEDNLKDEIEEGNNDTDTIFISLCLITLSLIITRNKLFLFKKKLVFLIYL